MNTAKIKSIVLFFIVAAFIFYTSNTFSRDGKTDLGQGQERSTAFLEAVEMVENIHIDVDFINSLGKGQLETKVRKPRLPNQGIGRDNPFMSADFSQPLNIRPADIPPQETIQQPQPQETAQQPQIQNQQQEALPEEVPPITPEEPSAEEVSAETGSPDRPPTEPAEADGSGRPPQESTYTPSSAVIQRGGNQ